jgi:CPA2 family monovalent cation:H+ antiporter-2
MARSEYRHELESDISPFKGIFLGVFFITVGAGINFVLLSENASLVLGLTFGLIFLKAGVLYGLAKLFQIQCGDKWLFSLGLAQAGEFGFVLLSFSLANAVMPADVANLLLLVVALSMLLTPLLFILYDWLVVPRYAQQSERAADAIEEPAKIIIAGHGRFGGIVNRALRAAGYETTVVDYSSEQLAMLRGFGLRVHFGDATRPDLLHAAGIENAKVLVIAIDNKEAITNMTSYVCRTYPDVHVVARAYDRMHVYDLWSIGCRDIIRETYDSSIRAGRSAFEALGFDRARAGEMMRHFEEMDREMMVDLADLHDIEVPVSENEPFKARFRDMTDEWERELKGRMGLTNASRTGQD